MPYNKSCSMKAYDSNVTFFHDTEGKPIDQAIAIAYDVLRRSCLSKKKAETAKKNKWTPKQIVKGKKESYDGQFGLFCEVFDRAVVILCDNDMKTVSARTVNMALKKADFAMYSDAPRKGYGKMGWKAVDDEDGVRLSVQRQNLPTDMVRARKIERERKYIEDYIRGGMGLNVEKMSSGALLLR